MKKIAELKKFAKYRKKMNEKILNLKNRELNRFFTLDSGVYRKGIFIK